MVTERSYAVAIVTLAVLCVAACSSGGGKQSTPTTTSHATATPLTAGVVHFRNQDSLVPQTNDAVPGGKTAPVVCRVTVRAHQKRVVLSASNSSHASVSLAAYTFTFAIVLPTSTRPGWISGHASGPGLGTGSSDTSEFSPTVRGRALAFSASASDGTISAGFVCSH